MPLIKCKVCENTISATAETCPHCGEKNLVFSKVVFHRKTAFTGGATKIDVIIDGISITSLKNDETFTTEMSAGNHIIIARGSIISKSLNITILPLKTYNIEMGFLFPIPNASIFIEGKIIEV